MATLKGQSSFELSVVTKTKEEPIGVGSYASVYEVIVHETVCAAKEMHPILVNTEDSKWKSVFLTECENCSKILHPNVVQFLGIYYPSERGKKAKLPWLVMELMHISLTDLIEKYEKTDIPLHFKFSIYTDVCQGLQFLHSQNIIHRDLYSSNILLTKHLVAKISDLGMAKIISPGFNRHTQTPGNMVFMPPEALSVNPVYGAPIDIFSFGCVCMHVTSMKWPTPKDKITDDDVILSEVQRREHLLVKMSSLPALRRLVERCLQKKPVDRPTIGEVIRSLRGTEYSHLPHESDSIIDLFNTVVRHEQNLTECRNVIQVKDQVIKEQKLQSDKELQKLNEILFQKDQLLHLNNRKLKQQDEEILLKNQELSENHLKLQRNCKELQQRDQQIYRLQKELEQKKQQLDNILKQKADIEEISEQKVPCSEQQNDTVMQNAKDDTTPKKKYLAAANISPSPKKVHTVFAKESNLNPDILALMEKTGAYQHSAVSYDQQTMTINIDCDDVTEEKIKEELFTAYRELMMGGKLKEHSVSVSDVQQASAIVDEYNKTFNHTYFKYDAKKGEIKCLSTDARQMQHVRKQLNVSFRCSNSAQSSALVQSLTTKSVFIDLPKISRRVTIKLSNIVDEDVDAIVNAANDRLQHAGGVAAAIDRASDGEVQKASNQLISRRGSVATGDAVATTVAGGKLKCKMVIHAVGPMAYQHKQNCGPLLKSACNNAMVIAERFECKSISFPPISSGLYAVSKELVANVMLSTLCSYKCHSPVLLTDVRIVIIDDPTYQVFLSVFHREKQHLGSVPVHPVVVPNFTTSTLGMMRPLKLQTHSMTSPSNSILPDVSILPISTATKNRRGSKDTEAENGSDVIIESCKRGTSNNIINDKEVKDASGNAKHDFVLANKSHSSNINSPLVSIINPAANPVTKSLLYPNLELTSDDPLRQHKDEPSQGTNRQEKRSSDGPKVHATLCTTSLPQAIKVEKNSCPICSEEATNKPPTAVSCCKHCKQVFCKSCLDEALKHKPYCPACTLPLRKITGNQPIGGIMISFTEYLSLPGYEKYGTITITYHIPGGTQGPGHPNPGQRFYGTSCTAYLPDSIEGRKVARLLRKAFDARLIFTIGTSHTTGTSVVIWNDIHHKTNMTGGPQSNGYPDPTYLNRVTEELAAKGIKE